MNTPIENRAGYASDAQRELLITLGRDPLLRENFFLTGGTALSVFYLGHRASNDIDLFTDKHIDLAAATHLILRPWTQELLWIAREQGFASVLLRDVKIDFVIDVLSEPEDRPTVDFDAESRWAIDPPEAIAGNKLAAMAGRIEPKDFIDYYFLRKMFPGLTTDGMFKRARSKDALFDDPEAAVRSIKSGLEIIKRSARAETLKAKRKAERRDFEGQTHGSSIPLPRLLKPIDWGEFDRAFAMLFQEIEKIQTVVG